MRTCFICLAVQTLQLDLIVCHMWRHPSMLKHVETLFSAKQFWVTAISAELHFGDGLQLQQKRCVGAAPSWAANIVGGCAETQRSIRPQRREGCWEGSGEGSEGRCWSFVPCLCRCEVAFGAAGCERRTERKAARSSVRGDPLRLGWLWRSRCTRAEAGGSGLWHLAEWQLQKPRHQSSSHGWATRQQRKLRWNGGLSRKHQADQSLWFKYGQSFARNMSAKCIDMHLIASQFWINFYRRFVKRFFFIFKILVSGCFLDPFPNQHESTATQSMKTWMGVRNVWTCWYPWSMTLQAFPGRLIYVDAPESVQRWTV